MTHLCPVRVIHTNNSVRGDVHLVQTLNELGVSCDTAAKRGWKALSNGELVSAAVAAGITCLLTRD
jgi:hypothetical protein